MEERRRIRARQRAASGILDKVQQRVQGDVTLTAHAAGAVAGLGAAGMAAGLGLAMLDGGQGRGAFAWAVAGAGVVLGLLLAALLLTNRRGPHPLRDRRRFRFLAFGAFACLAVSTLLGATRLVATAPPLGWLLGLLLAVGSSALGLWLMRRVEREVLRAAAARRRGWYAQIRAARLTRRMLGYAAYRQLRREGALPIKSIVFPGRTYLVPIRTTPSGARILVLEGDRPVGGLCLRPREPLPDPEEALTHILAIRTDERAWLGRANFFPQDRALTPQALGLAPGRPGNYER